MKVIKRNGQKVNFKSKKISEDIMEIFNETFKDESKEQHAEKIRETSNAIAEFIKNWEQEEITVDEIRDNIEMGLMAYGWYGLAKNYIVKRCKHEMNKQ